MQSRWSTADAPSDQLELRVYASRLQGAEPSLVQWGGGNTSVKLTEIDYRGDALDVLRVKGSGSDLKTIERQDFSGVRLADIERLRDVAAMTDDEMVEYLTRSLMSPQDSRPSIETLLHGFMPQHWVDHTHADAVVAVTNQPDGEAAVRRVFGARVAVVPWVRPGFNLSKAVIAAWEQDRGVDGVVLVNHGLITAGDEARESYERTIALVTAAEQFIADARGGARRFAGLELPDSERGRVAAVGLAIRGSMPWPVVVEHEGSPEMLEFVARDGLPDVTGRGPATPDHALRTKGWPAVVDASIDADADALHGAVRSAVSGFVERYEQYVARYTTAKTPQLDPFPRVVLVPGLGAFAVGRNAGTARMAHDIYRQTIEVIADAEAVGEYRPVAEPALFDIEYWPLELYKLGLAPPPRPLEGRIALVTGAASGIGRAVARRLAVEGAVVAVADIDAPGAAVVAEEIEGSAGPRVAVAMAMDVADEGAVVSGVEEVVARYGGLDIVVSNAGTAVVSSVESLELADWERSLAVNATGHFLVAREAVRALRRQERGGAMVFVSSKNAFAPGAEFGAYSAAKAAETQLAKVLAIECGGHGIRVNIVNPDAVFSGSKLWSPEVQASRAEAHGVAEDELEDFYAKRNLLGARILPEDVADSVAFLVSDQASKITGTTLTVDGGVASAFPR
ncbi:MAG: bifunctional rhamnulose-1-phosphate aldolase/short-chain dehydrogenase [Dehalococcoidia bacterium]|nr:bifunctional rhamnulose-1-phosphate aldolase/short-chain dehydrogenase [Dehalococcoidia bacterium]